MKQSIILKTKIWLDENKHNLNHIIENMGDVAAILDMDLKDDNSI